MAGMEKITIPQLVTDNWSLWSDKFEALLVFKDLWIAIEDPGSEKGKKANGQARALMTLYVSEAPGRLIKGEKSAAEAWKKLKDNFQKINNARVIQLRKKLAGMKMIGQSVMEYLGEFREIKLDLETAGQPASEVELAVQALRGLPRSYANLVEFLEQGDTELTLDAIQPKLMQKEQSLDLKIEEDSDEERDMQAGMAFNARNRAYGRAYGGSGNQGRGLDFGIGQSTVPGNGPRVCDCCGRLGHIARFCRMKFAECHNCGEKGHLRAVCQKPPKEDGEREVGAFCKTLAFTAWRENTKNSQGVWLLDSGSTEHVTADRGLFSSYRKLMSAQTIEGIGGEPLMTVGVGDVNLECQTRDGPSMITLRGVRHVPGAKANLFALRKATDAGATAVMTADGARIEKNGEVYMEAVQRGGLWEIVLEQKQKAFFAGRSVRKEPMRTAGVKTEKKGDGVKKTPVQVFEIDLEDEDWSVSGETETEVNGEVQGDETETVDEPQAAEAVGGMGEKSKTAETGGVNRGADEQIDGRTEAGEASKEKESEMCEEMRKARRNPERERKAPSKYGTGGSDCVWVTPTKKKK